AINEYKNKNYLKATKLFKEINIKYPEHEMADNYSNKISFEMKQTKNFEMLNFEKLSYAKAYIDYHNQNFNGAINEWKKVLEVNPKRKEVIEYVAMVKAYLLDYEQQKREKELKNEMLEYFNAGVAFFDNNKWLLTIKNMEKVQTLCKNNIFPESITYYKKAADYIEKSVAELSKTISAENEESNVRENTEVIDEVGAEKHYNEGLVLYASGKTFKAIKSWEIALRLDPTHSKAKKALEKVKELK
ncbi:tetratricopeptide repeat protein, partial [Elusimicrobiota bacterium]